MHGLLGPTQRMTNSSVCIESRTSISEPDRSKGKCSAQTSMRCHDHQSAEDDAGPCSEESEGSEDGGATRI